MVVVYMTAVYENEVLGGWALRWRLLRSLW